MPGKRLTTPAIVLRRYAFGESDRIAALFSPDVGLTRAFAKGQRRSTKRFGGILDILYFLEVDLVARRGEMMLLEGARLVDAYRPLSEDLMLYAAGCHLAEAAAAFASDGHADREAFIALTAGLEALCRGDDPAKISRAVELLSLRAAGLTPQLDACLVTRRPFAANETIAFDAELGGGVAPEKASLTLPRLSPAARRAMGQMLAGDFAAAMAVPASREDLREMRQALTQMFNRYAGRALRARQFAEGAARFAKEHHAAAAAPPTA